MANSYFRNQFQYTKEAMVCELYLHATFGSSGAITADTANTKGLTIAKTAASTGKYTITLSEPYYKLLGLQIQQLSGSSAPAAPICTMVSQAVSTAAAPTIIVQYYAIDNSTATNPASGEQVYFKVTLGNSSV